MYDKLEAIARILHENDHEYEDCLRAAIHTYQALTVHGYRSRIIGGELWDLAAPHWWAEAINFRTQPGREPPCRTDISGHTGYDLYVIEPVSRGEQFPQPAVFRGRPDNYVFEEHRNETGAIKQTMTAIAHVKDSLTLSTKRPDIVDNPRPEFAAEATTVSQHHSSD